jgi:hypothetical protein
MTEPLRSDERHRHPRSLLVWLLTVPGLFALLSMNEALLVVFGAPGDDGGRGAFHEWMTWSATGLPSGLIAAGLFLWRMSSTARERGIGDFWLGTAILAALTGSGLGLFVYLAGMAAMGAPGR